MLSKLRNWFGGKQTIEDRPPHAATAQKPPFPASKNASRQTPDGVAAEKHATGEIESPAPDKNVRTRRKFIREDTGTHETLKIIDESMFTTDDDEGIDPYNTGCFDKSKGWDKRFSK